MKNSTYTLDWKQYSELAQEAIAEGCVLLRNENNALPIRQNETVSVFGRIQFDYFKSGTGSGGMVNVPYVRTVNDGIERFSDVAIYQPLLNTYRNWVKENPFDNGKGWGTEPWSQLEMELSDEVVADAAANSDAALIILGRTAGEDRDNSATEGSYYLTAQEHAMLEKVCKAFDRAIVLLNVGNIIDMSWVNLYQPAAVMYIWQGGMEGGYGAADVVCGKTSPSGKLSDTIALTLEDYPSFKHFGDPLTNVYEEDIYIGYRYFETFAKDRVLYPFGFGLSYTTFDVQTSMQDLGKDLEFTSVVTNTGKFSGKEVVQIYACPPQGILGKPVRSLCGYEKTKCLAPGESETLTIQVSKASLASYDDGNQTGNRSCYVLEAGTYTLFAGTDVRSAKEVGSFELADLQVVSRHSERMAPKTPFFRLHPTKDLEIGYEPVPLRTASPDEHRKAEVLPSLPFTGDQGIKLADVYHGKASINQFLAQLTDRELMHLVRGEGMCSPKVTPGTAAAFGGLTEKAREYGIPAGCCSDGPSGIRMDCGVSAFSLPNGTLLACTFNRDLVRKLYEFEGLELYGNRIDSLLGPGINIHRCPLNGRNFEYCSEDPYLTGTIALAQLEGMSKYEISGTIKHFCANNQEYSRHNSNGVISERALREIYLKPFEICIRSGKTRSIMTTYGSVNGLWTAGHYDLVTGILRDEWGFEGIAMTDWWAKINTEGEDGNIFNRIPMVQAQNDVYMVTKDALVDEDNLAEGLQNGTLTRSELARCAKNICGFLLKSPAMQREIGEYVNVEHINQPAELAPLEESDLHYYTVSTDTTIDLEGRNTEGGTAIRIPVIFEQEGNYNFDLTVSADASELAQLSATLFIDSVTIVTYTLQGNETAKVTLKGSNYKQVRGLTHFFKLYFSISGMRVHALRIYLDDSPFIIR